MKMQQIRLDKTPTGVLGGISMGSSFKSLKSILYIPAKITFTRIIGKKYTYAIYCLVLQ